MTDSSVIGDVPEGGAARRTRLPLVLGLAAAVALGGGGFYAIYSGLLPLPGAPSATEAPTAEPLPDVAFVPLDQLIISLGDGAANRHLRFRAELEVATPHRAEVEALTPRIMDVLNSYLRAVSVADLESSTALVRLRAQMLRRIQVVTGEGRVRDLLVMEFVLN